MNAAPSLSGGADDRPTESPGPREPTTTPTAIGLDIGGTGIKAGPVDTELGVLTSPHLRTATPSPATPSAVVAAIERLIGSLLATTPEASLGAGLPVVVKRGTAETAAHLDPTWVGINVEKLFAAKLGIPTRVVNDADAAGIAEIRFGAGANQAGVVVMVTLGTGIGTGLFVDGTLVPNTELGHLEINGEDAETNASAVAREVNQLSWDQWGSCVDNYLARLEYLLWPDLIIVGGGVSEHFDRFSLNLHRRVPVVAAKLGNDAGIIGAALWASEDTEDLK